MRNRPSVAPADLKKDDRGGASTDQEVLWVQFPIGAGSSHTKMRVVPACMVTQWDLGWGLL